jgi:RNA polymerase sigma factor (sigma-70 family)
MSTNSRLPRFDTTSSCSRPESFDEFYRHELPQLIVFVRRMRATWEEAKDAAQDALVEALVRWDELTNPRVWVRVTAERKFLRQRLRLRQGIELARQPGWGVSTRYTPSAIHEETEMVLEEIGQLPPAQRRVMAWSFDGYTPTEIAAIIGEDVATVRSNLRHARRRLAESLTVAQSLPLCGTVALATGGSAGDVERSAGGTT